MCGIVGYLGDEDAKDVVLSGLKKLEYRGYEVCSQILGTKNVASYLDLFDSYIV